MYRLLVLSLLLSEAIAGLVRVPKIYNALITSDENLSPSRACSIIEPVLRTTALGVAFPPIVVHPQIHNHALHEINRNDKVEETKQQTGRPSEESARKEIPKLTYHGSLYPLAYDPYVPYGYHHDILYPALPYYQHPVFVDLGHYENNRKEEKDAEPLLPKAAINFKKNPEIPDVLPPLPIKDERKRTS